MVRERRVSWFIVANELQMEWIKKFNDGKKKWNLYDEKSAKTEDKSTKTEGECTAIPSSTMLKTRSERISCHRESQIRHWKKRLGRKTKTR